ncbi:hypothetical protein [Flavobacterium sp. N1994]|uniref:hypothetical protein n=1 Tax=Flavobacterium sp. N1994 TaxID=2986827 RepID=UPI002221952C|nr:hypothetical protein [Flavobacterium sp. N1994]
MKKLKIFTVLCVAMISSNFYSQDMAADKESLPIDAKTNCYVRYFYFPNLEAYFDNLEMVYYYKVKGEWETADELPANFGGYSIYNKVKVTITDYDGDEPYQLLSVHKKMYPYNAKGRFTNQTASSE